MLGKLLNITVNTLLILVFAGLSVRKTLHPIEVIVISVVGAAIIRGLAALVVNRKSHRVIVSMVFLAVSYGFAEVLRYVFIIETDSQTNVSYAGIFYFIATAGCFWHISDAVNMITGDGRSLKIAPIHISSILALMWIGNEGGGYIGGGLPVSFNISNRIINWNAVCDTHITKNGKKIGKCSKIVHRYARNEVFYVVEVIVFDDSGSVQLPWVPYRDGFEYIGDRAIGPDGVTRYTPPSWRDVRVTALGGHFYSISFELIV